MLRLAYVLALISVSATTLFAQCGQPCNPVGSPSGVPENGYTWVWDTATCSWVQVPGYGYPSPIVIDTDGTGFHLTSAADGSCSILPGMVSQFR